MEKKEKTIEVKQSQLDEMMTKIERLEKAASKQRLATVDSKTKKEVGKIISLRSIDNRIVISWSDMIENLVEKSPAGVWKENQKVEVEYEDGKKEKMPYVNFMRRSRLIPAEVKLETKDEDGIVFNVVTEDGKKYSIRDKFVN